MTCDIPTPRVPPIVRMLSTECFDPPDGFVPFQPACIPDEPLDPRKARPGGRTLIVVPYKFPVCSGDKGTFQVISGMGGQICDAIYIGNTVGRREEENGNLPRHGVALFPDDEVTVEPDCMLPDYGPDGSDIGPGGEARVPGGPFGDKGLAIRDQGQWYVVKMGQAGSAQVVTRYGRVLGGNCVPLEADDAVLPALPVYPEYRPWAYSADVLSQDFTIPEIADWTEYDLPVGYEHGDPLPAKPLPRGFFWSRLERDSSVAGRAWNADHEVFGENVTSTTPPSLVQATYLDSAATEIVLHFSSGPLTLGAALTDLGFDIADLVDFIQVATDSATALEVSLVLPTVDENRLTFEVSRAITPEETVTVTIAEGLVEEDLKPNTPGLSPLLLLDASRTYVLCFNYFQNEHLYEGDRVELVRVAQIEDLEEATRPVMLARLDVQGPRPVLNCRSASDITGYVQDDELLPFPEIESWSDDNLEEDFVVGDAPPASVSGLGWLRVKLPDRRAKTNTPEEDRQKHIRAVFRLTSTSLAADSPCRVSVSSMQLVPDVDGYLREVYEVVPVGGGDTIYPLVSCVVRGGNEVLALPITYGIKRVSGAAVFTGSFPQVRQRATATAAISSGAVVSATVTFGGSRYISAPSVTVVPHASGGSGATLTAVLGTNYQPWAALVTNCGSGYTGVPTVTVSGGSPVVNASARAIVIDGKVVQVLFNSLGRGFTGPCTLAITGGGGTGATATVVMLEEPIVQLTVTNGGSGYVAAPSLAIGFPSGDVPLDEWSDGFGWANLLAPGMGLAIPGGVTSGGQTIIIHDDRSNVPYTLVQSDRILFWELVSARHDDEDVGAIGAIAGFAPWALIA